VAGIVSFLSDDHVFIDAQDNRYKGKQRMGESWTDYFVLFPDYTITVEDMLEQENMVAVFGYASVTYKGLADPEYFWRLPHPEAFPVGNSQDFVAIGAKVDITSA
jgi:ketosteroid isomerase-like protein